MIVINRTTGIVVAMTLCLAQPAGLSREKLPAEAHQAVKSAVRFFHERISTRGGYLWWYNLKTGERAGEEKATDSQIWVQPPGTPSVGFAMLRAYQVTGDSSILAAAVDAGKALAWGQLASGGWDYLVDSSPAGDSRYYYRREAEAGKPRGKFERAGSTFDDNNTQSALRFLMVLDRLTHDPEIHRAVQAGLELMKTSQFPNGAWPQRYPLAKSGYSRWYTFNDNALNDCIQVMLDAYTIYGLREYLSRACKGGEFIISSQLPQPQAGWAQQYDYEMRPAWARKFEPPAANSQVTSRNIRSLIKLYLVTGNKKFLRPIPAAVKWLRASPVDRGIWARFYELETNRPLYMTRDYKLVYTDDDLPTHYSFKGRYAIPETIALYHELKLLGRHTFLESHAARPSPLARRTRLWALENQVRRIIRRQDPTGAWYSNGLIKTRDFCENLRILADYLELVAGKPAVRDIPVKLLDAPITEFIESPAPLESR